MATGYPSPFTDQTRIEYNLPLDNFVHHTLLDTKGQVVGQPQELVEQASGVHQRQVNTANLPAGVYLCQVQAGNQTRTIRLVKNHKM